MRNDRRGVLHPIGKAGHGSRLRRGERRFGVDQSGAVLVETALVLLIVVPLLIGLAEFSAALTLQRRVETAAATAADLMTRSTEGTVSIGEAELNAIPAILRKIVRTGPEAAGDVGFRISIFEIVVDKDGNVSPKPPKTYKCGFGDGGAGTAPSGVLTGSNGLTRLVLVETEADFRSNFSFFIDTIKLRGESYFAPRIGNEIKLPENKACITK